MELRSEVGRRKRPASPPLLCSAERLAPHRPRGGGGGRRGNIAGRVTSRCTACGRRRRCTAAARGATARRMLNFAPHSSSSCAAPPWRGNERDESAQRGRRSNSHEVSGACNGRCAHPVWAPLMVKRSNNHVTAESRGPARSKRYDASRGPICVKRYNASKGPTRPAFFFSI